VNRERLQDRAFLAAVAALWCMLTAGTGLLLAARQDVAAAGRELAAARGEQARAHERRVRAAQGADEAAARLAQYRQLAGLRILGPERRLEWTESLARLRAQLALPELRYQIAPRRLLHSLAEGPRGVALYASALTLDMGLLHEGDLFRFLEGLRQSGNAYPAVRRCALERAPAASAANAGAARVRARCELDLITIHDGGGRA
jgi:hypothetical protein